MQEASILELSEINAVVFDRLVSIWGFGSWACRFHFFIYEAQV